MAATFVRSRPERSAASSSRLLRELEQPLHLRLARERDGVDAARRELADQRRDALVVGGRRIHVWRDAIDVGAALLEVVDELPILILAVELQRDAS